MRELLAFAEANGVHAQAYVNGELVYRSRGAHSDVYEAFFGFPGTVVPALGRHDDVATPKVLFMMDEALLPDIQQRARALFPALTIKRSRPEYLEFMQSGIHKGEALEFVARHYGVAPQQIIAVGDSDIDLPMMTYAGLSVAMANASSDIQQLADVICPSNQQDGVADVINKYILEAQHEDQAEAD